MVDLEGNSLGWGKQDSQSLSRSSLRLFSTLYQSGSASKAMSDIFSSLQIDGRF